MDYASLITIIITIIIIYFLIKLIISPIIKAVLGIITFLIIIYILQKFFGFDLNKILTPFGINLNTESWNLNWLTGPVDYYVNMIKSFLDFILSNFLKNVKPQ